MALSQRMEKNQSRQRLRTLPPPSPSCDARHGADWDWRLTQGRLAQQTDSGCGQHRDIEAGEEAIREEDADPQSSVAIAVMQRWALNFPTFILWVGIALVLLLSLMTGG